MAESCALGVLEAIHFKVVEASPDAKIVINDNADIVVFNRQAEFLFGYDRTKVLCGSIEILLPVSQRGFHKIHRDTFFAEPRTREMRTGQVLEGLKRNRQRFQLKSNLSPSLQEGLGRVFAIAHAVRGILNA